MEKKTACECPMAGYCNRHGIKKTAHQHKLCQMHQGYFEMWDSCRGPGQNPNNCIKPDPPKAKEETPRQEVTLPSKLQMAKNFIQSAAKHVVTGAQSVNSETQEARLEICNNCEFLKKDELRCGKCGCPVQTKTKWATSTCPIGRL